VQSPQQGGRRPWPGTTAAAVENPALPLGPSPKLRTRTPPAVPFGILLDRHPGRRNCGWTTRGMEPWATSRNAGFGMPFRPSVQSGQLNGRVGIAEQKRTPALVLQSQRRTHAADRRPVAASHRSGSCPGRIACAFGRLLRRYWSEFRSLLGEPATAYARKTDSNAIPIAMPLSKTFMKRV